MTNKQLSNEVSVIVAAFIARKGLRPGLAVKGGQQETAQSFIGMAIIELAETILAKAGAPVPVAPAAPAAAEAA